MPLITATTSGTSGWWVFIAIIALYLVFYVLFFRPRMKRARESRMVNRGFEVGDQIQTVGGLVATVTDKGDHVVTLRTEGGTELVFLRQAIAQKYVAPAVPAQQPALPEPTDGTAH
jgi:preprotein translocase subunit YajC